MFAHDRQDALANVFVIGLQSRAAHLEAEGVHFVRHHPFNRFAPVQLALLAQSDGFNHFLSDAELLDDPVVFALKDRTSLLTVLAMIATVLAPLCSVARARTMDEAVAKATELALRGDTVLLSPACASQDMFKDYKERGNLFARAAQRLPK